MGVCCSNELTPGSFRGPAFDKKKFSSYQLQQIEDYKKYTSLDWDNTLKNILSNIDTKNTYWPYFVTVFSDCGSQFKSSLSLSKADQSLAITRNVSEATVVIEEYSFIEEEARSSKLTLSNNQLKHSRNPSQDSEVASSTSSPGLTPSRPPELVRSESVENLVKTFEKPPCVFFTNPGKEGLRNSLHFLLSESDHILQTFIKRFHRKFQNKFEKELTKVKSRRFTERDNATYKTVCEIIKLFVFVLKKFISWMYNDLISRMKPVLRNEFLELEWIVESVIYELLFSQTESIQNKLVMSLMKSKYSQKTRNFQKILKKRMFDHLGDGSDFAKSHHLFTLNECEVPYREVIESIRRLQASASPHQEFEKMISLEKEILECACNYYNNETETTFKLADGFDRDVKVEVMLYCISKSQNIDLIVSSAFIKEFVHKDYLEHVQGYYAFDALLDHLLCQKM